MRSYSSMAFTKRTSLRRMSNTAGFSIKRYVSVYFLATGGIGALLSTKVRSSKAVLFSDLGPEAIYKLEVKDFPLLVGIDSKGNNVYGKAGRKKK